jgi:hypothetical protein
MNWINNLEQNIKESLNVSKAIYPDDDILKKAGTSEVRFRMLLKNEVKMNAWEIIVFSDWLGIDPGEMVSPALENAKNNMQPAN